MNEDKYTKSKVGGQRMNIILWKLENIGKNQREGKRILKQTRKRRDNAHSHKTIISREIVKGREK